MDESIKRILLPADDSVLPASEIAGTVEEAAAMLAYIRVEVALPWRLGAQGFVIPIEAESLELLRPADSADGVRDGTARQEEIGILAEIARDAVLQAFAPLAAERLDWQEKVEAAMQKMLSGGQL